MAAEAANNSNSGGAMITVLTLGIPGDAITAVIMGVFIIHGIAPGPTLMSENPDLIFGIFASLIAINCVTVSLLFLLTRQFARLVIVDPRWLGIGNPHALLCRRLFDQQFSYGVWVAIGAGLFGWWCAIAKIPVVPLVLGLVIGDMLELSLRQSLAVSDGSPMIFVTRRIAAALTICCVLALCWPLIDRLLGYRRATRKSRNASTKTVV